MPVGGAGGSPERSFTPSLLPRVHVQSKEEVALFRKRTQPFGLEKMGRRLIYGRIVVSV